MPEYWNSSVGFMLWWKSLSHGNYWIQACPQLPPPHIPLFDYSRHPQPFTLRIINYWRILPPLHLFPYKLRAVVLPQHPPPFLYTLACIILYYTVLFLYLYWSSNILLVGETSAFQGRRMNTLSLKSYEHLKTNVLGVKCEITLNHRKKNIF